MRKILCDGVRHKIRVTERQKDIVETENKEAEGQEQLRICGIHYERVIVYN